MGYNGTSTAKLANMPEKRQVAKEGSDIVLNRLGETRCRRLGEIQDMLPIAAAMI
jgi:hypothetical protein